MEANGGEQIDASRHGKKAKARAKCWIILIGCPTPPRSVMSDGSRCEDSNFSASASQDLLADIVQKVSNE